VKGVYNASQHPDVKSGKKQEDEVLMEFLETFETHHNTMTQTGADGVVTKEEFLEYYNNVSGSIDNDQYFELMMNNAWKLNETGPTQASGRYGSPFRPTSGAPTAFTGGALKTTSSSYGNQGTEGGA
jgi:hypothetical protein